MRDRRDLIAELTGAGIGAELGNRIREAREQAGMTQGELAGVLGVSQGYISYRELGERPVSVTDLLAVACATGVSAASLLPPQPDIAENDSAPPGAVKEDGAP